MRDGNSKVMSRTKARGKTIRTLCGAMGPLRALAKKAMEDTGPSVNRTNRTMAKTNGSWSKQGSTLHGFPKRMVLAKEETWVSQRSDTKRTRVVLGTLPLRTVKKRSMSKSRKSRMTRISRYPRRSLKNTNCCWVQRRPCLRDWLTPRRTQSHGQ